MAHIIRTDQFTALIQAAPLVLKVEQAIAGNLIDSHIRGIDIVN